MKQNAFSLLELSIVLVIIGLIAGGIVAGASMIRAAELRAVITEQEQFKTAVYTFRDKYLGLPGDLRNAESFWGTMATGTCPNATAGTGTKTCNGDGNRQIQQSGSASQSNEIFTFWQHLANAELIAGNYTGISGSGSNYNSVIDENIPISKLSGSGWTVFYEGTKGSSSQMFAGEYGNVLYFGSQNGSGGTISPIISPAEAWNMDKKMDDGKAATGKLRVFENTSPATPGCSTTDDATTADYALTDSNALCSLVFPQVF